MKKLILLIIVSNIVSIVFAQTIYTPTGSSVSYSYDNELSQEQIAVYDAYYQSRINSNSWDAVIIGSSSTQYNCHSYAWHVSDGGNLVWIDSPDPYFSGVSPTYVSSTNTEDSLRKIVYEYDYGGHSAISTNTENYVISKWGSGPLVRHLITDWPWIGDTQPTGTDYYEIGIDGNQSVQLGGVLSQTTISISGASYNWSGDGYYICGYGNNYVGSIAGLINTPTGVYAPVKVEITSPNSNTTVKGDRKNYIAVSGTSQLPTISAAGQSRLVCSSGLEFTVNNLLSGWIIEWTCGPNLTLSSAQGSNPCTFYSTGDGSSWVDATVHPPCGGSFGLEQYNVCSGKPILNISGPSQGYNYNTYTFYANPNTYSSPTDYEWTLSPMLNNDIDDYGTYADYNFYDAYEGYQVVARAKNTCSSGAWGDWSITNISIYESEQFQMSPNPASEFVTISLKKSSESKLKQEKFEAIYSIRIIDVYGNLKYSATRSGDSFTLPVNNLVDGNYFIQITREKKSSNLKLIVKH